MKQNKAISSKLLEIFKTLLYTCFLYTMRELVVMVY